MKQGIDKVLRCVRVVIIFSNLKYMSAFPFHVLFPKYSRVLKASTGISSFSRRILALCQPSFMDICDVT